MDIASHSCASTTARRCGIRPERRERQAASVRIDVKDNADAQGLSGLDGLAHEKAADDRGGLWSGRKRLTIIACKHEIVEGKHCLDGLSILYLHISDDVRSIRERSRPAPFELLVGPKIE